MSIRNRPAGLEDVDWTLYDFIDLGCSTGRSVGYGQRRFGGTRGLGVDMDVAKLAHARADGIEVVQADATRLNLSKAVRFVSMLDFLEHLPDLQTVERVIASAAEAATDFLFIKHPSFEGKEYTEAQGFRQYWWNWHGHTAHIRVADYCETFDRLGLNQYKIRYLGRIASSRHETVIPVSAPKDCTADTARKYQDHPDVPLSPPLWRRQDIFVALRSFETDEWAALTAPTAADQKLLERHSHELSPLPPAPDSLSLLAD